MFFALICGGNANNEGNAGPFYTNTNNRSTNTNTNIGAHLIVKNIVKTQTLALAKKSRLNNKSILVIIKNCENLDAPTNNEKIRKYF